MPAHKKPQVDPKTCSKCLLEKPLVEFPRMATTKGAGHRAQCRDCCSELAWKNNLSRCYGMTLEEYEARAEAQGGVCAICGELPIYKGKIERRLAVDHDHSTGRVRGLLCRPCNTMLGFMKDSVENLQRAIAYLEAS